VSDLYEIFISGTPKACVTPKVILSAAGVEALAETSQVKEWKLNKLPGQSRSQTEFGNEIVEVN
jgi:hypothetical protein